MKLTAYLFIINIFFCLATYGQGKKTSFRIGIDPLKLLSPITNSQNLSLSDDSTWSTTRFEMYSALTYDKIISITFDGGFSRTSGLSEVKTLEYYSRGFYFKPGIDFNLNYSEKFQNFFGLRVGLTKFHDRGTVTINGSYWNNHYYYSFPNGNNYAQWWETVAGFRFTVKRVGFACTARGRFLSVLNRSQHEYTTVHIPGYGKNTRISGAINFEVSYRLIN